MTFVTILAPFFGRFCLRRPVIHHIFSHINQLVDCSSVFALTRGDRKLSKA